MDALLRFSVARPRWVLALAALLTLGACFFIGGIELRLDGRSLIPQGHPSMAQSDRAAERFALRDVVVLAVAQRGSGVFTPQGLAAVTQLSRGLEEVEGVIAGSVVSLATVPRLVVEGGSLDLRPLLVRGDEIDRSLIKRLRREVAALGWDNGVLVARDGRAAAVYARIEPHADRYTLLERIEELATEVAGGEVEVYWGGSALAQAVLGKSAALDLLRLVPLVLLVIALVLALAYGHLAPAAVSLAEVGVSLVWTVGLMGLVEQPVFVTTLALPVILVVIGVSDDVYALNRFFHHPDRGNRAVEAVVLEAFTEVRRPVVLTSLTTMAGLICLTVPGLEPLRVFGVFGAVSVLFSTLLTFTLVPALLVVGNPRVAPRKWVARRYGEFLVELVLGLIRRLRPVGVLAVVAVLGALSLWLLTSIRVGDNWIRNLPPDSSVVQGDRAINELLAGTNTLDLMISVGQPGGLFEPRTFEALGAIEAALLENPSVGAVEGPYSLLARVDAALDGHPYEGYANSHGRGARAMDSAAIEQAALLLESLRRSPLQRRWDEVYEQGHLTVFVRGADYERIESVLDSARRATESALGADNSVAAFGDGWIGYTTIRLLVQGQSRSIALAILFDLLLLALVFRSLRTALVAVAPVVVSVLVVFGLLALSGEPLGTANSMFAAIALGVGVDFSIHLVAMLRGGSAAGPRRYQDVRQVLRVTGPAILLSALAMASGFGVLAFSDVLPNQELGTLVALSMLTCALMTVVMIPSLALLAGRKPQTDAADAADQPEGSFSVMQNTIY